MERSEIERTYNKFGFLVKEDNKTKNCQEEFVYDNNGNLVQVDFHFNSEYRKDTRCINEYVNNLLVRKTIIIPESTKEIERYEYFYDANKNNILTISFVNFRNIGNVLVSAKTCKYIDNKCVSTRIVETNVLNKKRNGRTYKNYSYERNPIGTEESSYIMIKDQKIKSNEKFFSNNLLIKKNIYEKNAERTAEYTYDNHQNIICKKEYILKENGEREQTKEYTYNNIYID